MKYRKRGNNLVAIKFTAGLTHDGKPCLDAADNGPGIEEKTRKNLFEPFYTTDSRSTGLGLFLVREICALNAAEINYIDDSDGKRFRIIFGERGQQNEYARMYQAIEGGVN